MPRLVKFALPTSPPAYGYPMPLVVAMLKYVAGFSVTRLVTSPCRPR